MGTKITNREKYLDLWNLFENEYTTSKKLESNTLSGFVKYYEKYSDSSENNDYQKIYEKLKKMKQRKDSLKSIRENTLLEIEAFYKFLKKDYFNQELAEDEGIKDWFN